VSGIPTVEESQLLLERIEGVEEELGTLDAEIGRYKEALKSAREAHRKKVDELRGIARARSEDHPLLDEKGGGNVDEGEGVDEDDEEDEEDDRDEDDEEDDEE